MSVFEAIEKTASAEQERLAGTRAVIAVQERATEKFAKYVGNAKSEDEKVYRLSFIESDLRAIAAEAAADYEFGDVQRLYEAGHAAVSGGHKSDCSCGFCANKGAFGKDKDEEKDEADDKKGETKDDDDKDDEKPESKKPWESKTASVAGLEVGRLEYTAGVDLRESMWHVSDVETGDSYAAETLDLGSTTGEDSTSTQGSPSIDKSRVPDGGLKPIDVPSNLHPSEQQGIHEEPDYEKDLPGVSNTGEHQDGDKSVSPPDTARTDTWTGTEGLADPVTSSRVAKWSVLA